MRVLFSVVLLVSCAYLASFAQTPPESPTSTFKGIVTDLYGAAIKNASVLVETESHNWKATSDDNGQFTLALPTASYRFTIVKTGFKKLILTDFAISSGAQVSYNFKLEIGRCSDCDGEIYGLDSVERVTAPLKVGATPRAVSKAQEFLPSPPQDRTLIYILDEQNRLVPLPFEQGLTSLHTKAMAKSTKISYVELKGEHAATLLNSTTPRLFLFTYQRPGVHPPFLVWLTPHRGARRVTAVAQKGLRGFAIASEEIIKPVIRVLAPAGDQVFMEVHPRASLVPGEYAIIGDDLARLATFRIGEAPPP